MRPERRKRFSAEQTRKGLTRIPIFGSRIPQIANETVRIFEETPPAKVIPNEIIAVANRGSTKVAARESQSHELSKHDLGKKVRVNDREGVLRFVGTVHFAPGVWCGVEVESGKGKNNGTVRGVRYFECPEDCGLMAMRAKVSLSDELEQQQEEEQDHYSGPYSMIFGVGESAKPFLRSDTFEVNEEDSPLELDRTYDKNETFVNTTANIRNLRSDTFDVNEDGDDGEDESFVEMDETMGRKDLNETVVQNKRPSVLDYTHNFVTAKMKFSTPVAFKDTESTSSPRKIRMSPSHLDDDCSKRDSLEFEESLGILTPDQMIDVTGLVSSRTPSSENIRLLPHDALSNFQIMEDLSPKIESSLGIIDEHVLSALTIKTDKTMNLDLQHDRTLTRIEQTPSPEDLPLDPTPPQPPAPPPLLTTQSENGKCEQQKKPPSSFITSITSITSLDTGYQGDGENSRPASRGAETSPLTRRQPRRPDPMTDSDFYTESDADNHEENQIRTDRKAQVIDGTLYGVDPQLAADIYANNKENMDSSGIFTDIETRTEELSSADNDLLQNLSPSDSSTKTISEDSQGNINLILNKTPINETIIECETKSEDKTMTVTPPSPSSTVASSPASARNRSPKGDLKKYKMPKRNVASKVKAMLEPNNKENADTKKATTTMPKKPAGRWDAVMNKISKSPSADNRNLKEVKSKVFSSISTNVQQSRAIVQPDKSTNKTPNNKIRRVRARAAATNNTSSKSNSNAGESINSSLSDLSGASPAKKIGSAKKQRDVVRVTQVLTASKISPKVNNHTTEVKNKNNANLNNEVNKSTAANRNLFNNKEKKKDISKGIIMGVKGKKHKFSASDLDIFAKDTERIKNKTYIWTSIKLPNKKNKEIGRATVKGGRVSPGARPPQQQHHHQQPQKPQPKTAEALAVLVQHLVFNLDAFSNPSLRKEIYRVKTEAGEAQLLCTQLEEALNAERKQRSELLEEQRIRFGVEVTHLIEKHRDEISLINAQQLDVKKLHQHERDLLRESLSRQHESQIRALKLECEKLRQTHVESLDILREENDAIREEIDERNMRIRELEQQRGESDKLRRDYEAREVLHKEKLTVANEEICRLREENEALYASARNGGSDNSLQEVQSLRVVLELKQSEFAELRKALAEATQKADLLPAAEEKISGLLAKCEDLQHQLERKNDSEHQLLTENKKLHESFKEESNQKKRIQQYNEELTWKLQQNKEIVHKVIEEADSAFCRNKLSASFNERYTVQKPSFERTLSFRENSFGSRSPSSLTRSRKSRNSLDLDPEEVSPPSSPKVKGVVEKSDSVSYVLEMDESPDVVASRIVRRSFRNATPPKNTPTKSPANKRPRIKSNPLTQSLSGGSLHGVVARTRAVHSEERTGEVHEEIFMWDSDRASSTPNQQHKFWTPTEYDEYCEEMLPSLPSEIGQKNGPTLPLPKHLAESNSDDEEEDDVDDECCSTSSSSGQL
ncbi:PREDICTED: CAP-Gly domain-containing linker protein 1-like isoform X2 [Nicrophorus vespilloides]|uniref:CAP-Gly domain-containing linker protein 1-like isoform X2 n=1 Tax=Nicrophorus vespilloides TaxID=110193 RepID=A0ABM1MLD5_NICVS|nr:PREDICTED: CAP-Gly domain-containing linker protein 1-like isoform X2 [Nicrophorus vespilloides]